MKNIYFEFYTKLLNKVSYLFCVLFLTNFLSGLLAFTNEAHAYRREPIPGRHNCWTYYFTRDELLANRNYLVSGVISAFKDTHVQALLNQGVVYNIHGDCFKLEQARPAPKNAPRGPNPAEIARRKAEADRQAELARQNEMKRQLEIGKVGVASNALTLAKAELEIFNEERANRQKLDADFQAIQDAEIAKAQERAEKSEAAAESFCFPADTPIVVKDNSQLGYGTKAISEVEVNDWVLTCNIDDGGFCEFKQVLAKSESSARVFYKLSFGNKELRVTGNHLFYRANDQKWVAAQNLGKGDLIHSVFGQVISLESVEVEEKDHDVQVFNLQVDGNPNYFACDLLVHNCNMLAALAVTSGEAVAGAVVLGEAIALAPAAAFVGSAAVVGYALHEMTKPAEGERDSAGKASNPTVPKNPVEDLLGEGATVKTNKAGDKVFISKDGKTKVRFDVNESHGDDPHMHVEKQSATGKWKDMFDEHRFYPGKGQEGQK